MLEGMTIMKGAKHAMKSKKKKVFSSSIGLLVLFLMASAFAAPLTNSKSETTHNDVVSKKVAKKTAKQLNKKSTKKSSKVTIEKPATNNNEAQKPATQAASSNSGSYLSKISSISPSKIKSAAEDESQAAQLIQTETGMSSAKSQQAATELFSNSKYTDLRNDITSGNWFGAYAQYQKLSNDGSLEQLQDSLSN